MEEFHKSTQRCDLKARDGGQAEPGLAVGLLEVGGAKIKDDENQSDWPMRHLSLTFT